MGDVSLEQTGLKESDGGLLHEVALMVVVLDGKALFEWAGPLNTGGAFGSVTFSDDGVDVVHALDCSTPVNQN